MGRALAAGLVRGRPEVAGTAADRRRGPGGGRGGGGRRRRAAGDLRGGGGRGPGVRGGQAQGRAATRSPRWPPACAPGAVVLSVVAGWDLDRLAAAAPGAALVRTMPNLAVRHGAGIVAVATPRPRRAPRRRRARPAGAPGRGGAPARDPVRGRDRPRGQRAGPGGRRRRGPGGGRRRRGPHPGPGARDGRRPCSAGTAALLADGTDPAVLRQRVSSPAGTTIAGVAVLERGAVRAHVADAVQAAARRAAEL